MNVKRLAMILALALVFSLVGAVPVRAEEIPDVTGYSYTVTPILSPFTYYLYVRTDNPDPTSFRLVDRSSKFYSAEDRSEIRIPTDYGYSYVEVDPGTYYISQNLYPDVVYEDESIYRVPGGYIFRADGAYSDGGEFVLLQKIKSGNSIIGDKFEQTDVTIPCQPLNTRVGYLIDTCTTDQMSFFEKLDAVQARLDQIAVYPRGVYDVDSPNEERPYPLLAASPYPELALNQHYDNMYDSLEDGILASSAYPFILDSLGVPGTIRSVAEELEPDCEVVSGTYHYQVDITFEGETRSYGGAGSGGRDPLYSDRVQKTFTFQGGDDLGTSGTIEDYRDLLLSYGSVAAEDAQKYRDLIAGTTFHETIRATGGTWMKIGAEGFFSYGTSFAYAVPLGTGTEILSDAWVDGRYIGAHEAFVFNEKFEDHPTADIVLHDVTYTDRYGQTHTQDVIYSYDDEKDAWTAPFFYNNDTWYSDGWEIPEELILTREQVEAMDLDCNSSHLMESGLIYDGTEYPGTPFMQKTVTGVRIPETLKLYVGQKKTVTAVVEPADAFLTNVSWTSSDSAVAEVQNDTDGVIYAAGEGTAVLTVTTKDGSYTAVCVVTVLPEDPCKDGHSFISYVSDGNATCTGDGTKTAVCERCDETDTVTEEGSALGHTYENDKDTTCETCGQIRQIGVKTTPMYRLYNPNSGEHFYTGSIEEKDNLVTAGWTYEGIAWNAPTNTGDPVYRLYNPNSGDHHYTMSAEEKDMLVSVGWKYEGVAWNSATPDNLPLYRLYNPNADCGSHHYTGSTEERDFLVSVGWIYEGIGWFGMLK